MQSLYEIWGKPQENLSLQQSIQWRALAEEALSRGGALSLDPRKDSHAEHLRERLGDDSQLARYFPRKADIFKATALAYELYGGAPRKSLLQLQPHEAGVHNVHPYVGVPHFAVHPDGNAILATGIVSHPQLLQAVELILEIIDADTGELVGSSAIPPQFNTRYQQVKVTAPLGKQDGPRRFTAGLTAHYVVDGEAHGTPTFAAAKLATVDAISQVTAFAPVPKSGTATQVTIAIDRSGAGVDYSYQGLPIASEIVVPFSGQAQLAGGFSVAQPPAASGSLILIDVTGTSGGAQYALAAGDVVAAFYASEGLVFTWSMGPDWQQHFPQTPGTPCVFNVTLNAVLNVTSSAGPNTANLVVSSVGPTSQGGRLLPLSIQWGCVAPGTMVQMADGSLRAIETICENERVRMDANGSVAYVRFLMDGTQHEPMWRVQAGGRSVLVTHDHPFIGEEGPCMACSLKVGDFVATVSGMQAIENIAEEDYLGKVYNLALQDEQGNSPAGGGTFVGAGFVLGDSEMQTALARTAEPMDVPQEWLLDAMNSARLVAGIPLLHA